MKSNAAWKIGPLFTAAVLLWGWSEYNKADSKRGLSSPQTGSAMAASGVNAPANISFSAPAAAAPPKKKIPYVMSFVGPRVAVLEKGIDGQADTLSLYDLGKPATAAQLAMLFDINSGKFNLRGFAEGEQTAKLLFSTNGMERMHAAKLASAFLNFGLTDPDKAAHYFGVMEEEFMLTEQEINKGKVPKNIPVYELR